MKKLLTMFFVVATVLCLCTFAVSAAEIVDVKMNGAEIDFDVPAQVINDRTLVPLRAIFEVMGAEVNWDNDTETVTANKGDTSISLQIGSTSLFVNDVEKVIDVPAQLVDDRTLIPARAVAESFGATVDWDEANQTVIITDANTPDFAAMLEKMGESEIDFGNSEIALEGKLDAEADGEFANITINGDVKILQETQEFSVELSVETENSEMSEEGTVAVYYVEEDGKRYGYIFSSQNNVVMALKEETEAGIDNDAGMTLKGFDQVTDYLKIAKLDKVADKDTAMFSFAITGEEINAIVAKAVESGELTETEFEGFTDDLYEYDGIKINVWLDQDDGSIVKAGLDLSDMLYMYFEEEEIAEGSRIDACYINVEIKSLGTVEDIQVPENVKNQAVDIDSLY